MSSKFNLVSLGGDFGGDFGGIFILFDKPPLMSSNNFITPFF